jgi:hypothetical protein
MSFQAHPTYSDFERNNSVFAGRLKAFLVSVSGDTALHARFLNTLSMMEHMGSRRIMMTQSSSALCQETLKHMAEEARHAFFFKRQADRFAGAALDYADADMIAPAFARMYFKRLECFIANDVKDETKPRYVAYLYMSMIIEFRAVWAFSIYQSALDGQGVPISLKSLLAEEQGHLSDMEAKLEALGVATADRLHCFLAKEQSLFERLLDRLENADVADAAAA